MIALLFSALTAAACEICLKLGAIETAERPTSVPWLGISGLESKWVWFGILLTIFSFGAWVRAVRVIPLSIAYTLGNSVYIFIPLGCWWILGETISPRRWVGIALVIVGLIVIARPFAKLDEKLSEAL
jgi:undecaprenyl phosphate-alpha-L-ara4N flippase subunit ArnF